MMANQREAIYEALFTLLQTTAPSLIEIPTFSRRFQHWEKVPINQMPALFMQQYEEEATQLPDAMALTKWVSTVNVWMYFNATNPTALPDQTYNNLLDGLELALKPPPGQSGRQTLGGLVTHVWISGKIPYSDGALDRKAVILVQLKVMWNGY